MRLPYYTNAIIETLNNCGYEAYVVGGCIRDFLLKKTPKDYDITTNALPGAVKKIFKRTVDTGIKHGTVTVLIDKNATEVTTYRVDGEYTDNRRPDSVAFTRSLKDDLMRRDFTVNAMAYHPKSGIVDYHGGMKDLENKIIRTVGDADKRFNEDALRMFRAIRFAAQLSFELDSAAKASILKNSGLIQNISAERIRDEFLKIISSPDVEILHFLVNSKLLFHFSPALNSYAQDNLANTVTALNNLPLSFKTETKYPLTAYFMFCEPFKAKKILLKLRLDNNTIRRVFTLLSGISKPLPADLYETRLMLNHIGADAYTDLLLLKQHLTKDNTKDALNMLKGVLSANDCYTLSNLAVNGNDIINMGASGKTIGDTLELCLQYVLKDQTMNKREFLLEKARLSLENLR